MEISWQWFVRQGMDLVGELAQLDKPGPDKLARLRTWVEGTLEPVDDRLADLLPGGFGMAVRWLVDSEIANDLQRRFIYDWIAEFIYQRWAGVQQALGSLQADHK